MGSAEKIIVTGATGKLGRLVVAGLVKLAPSAQVIAVVRNPAKAQDLAVRGVELRVANYDDPAAWKPALAGADKVLLISSSEVGRRVSQHRNVVDAAKAAGARLLAYTSIIRADTSLMGLATEHLATERYIQSSSIPFVFLRNSWYYENYTQTVGAALHNGVILGAAGEGRISAAARADYAAAAAVVLADDVNIHTGKSYELAGDSGFTLAEYAAEVARQSGKSVVYKNLPEAEYRMALQGIGLDELHASVIAESAAKAAAGALHEDSRQLSQLIGRSTMSLEEAISAALSVHSR